MAGGAVPARRVLTLEFELLQFELPYSLDIFPAVSVSIECAKRGYSKS